MTNHDYKAIADRLVERGIGECLPVKENGVIVRSGERYRAPYEITSHALSDKEFCHDWRVAGACMEKSHMVFVERHGRWQVRYDKAYGDRTREWHSAESLPLAIIQAYVEATDGT